MRHCDSLTLAAVALGEGDSAQIEHVAQCAVCQREVDALVEVRELLGAARNVELVTPPPSLWDAIESSIAADGTQGSDPADSERSAAPAAEAPESGPDAAEVVELRRRPRWFALAAAAVVGGVVGAGAVAMSSSTSNPELVVASATLEPIGGAGAAGEAIVADYDGRREIVLTMPDAPPPSGYYEAWLLDPSGGGMIALGTVPSTAGSATLPIPAGVDIAVFNAVDVSDEPFDGNPAHSTISVMRGTLSS